MFRLIVRRPDSGVILFISQPFRHYKIRGREVETEHGRMVMAEGLEASVTDADGLSLFHVAGETACVQVPAGIQAQRDCA